MFDNIDPTVIQTFIENLDTTSASNCASIGSFFLSVSTWMTERKKHHEPVSVSDLAAFLRTENKTGLADIIERNAELFQQLMISLSQQVAEEIRRLDDNQQRRHEESLSLNISKHTLQIRLRADGWKAANFVRGPGTQHVELFATFTIVNNSRSRIRVNDLRITVICDGQSATAKCETGQQRKQIENNGGSETFRVKTTSAIDWSEGSLVQVESAILETDQVGDLEYSQADLQSLFG